MDITYATLAPPKAFMNYSKSYQFLITACSVFILLVACDTQQNETAIAHQPEPSTLSPVVSPFGNDTEFHLKEWSEPLALTLVDQAEKYAQNYLHADMDWILQRNAYMQVHEIVEVSAKEAILRFPETQSRERLEWLIVLSESLLAAAYGWEPPNERILALLTKGLNEETYDLNDLDTALNPFGFEVRQVTSYRESIPQYATNLFGDGQTVPIIVISRIVGDPLLPGNENGYADDDGFVITIRKDEQGKYVPLLIDTGWFISLSGFERIRVGDVTADGIPEIEVVFFANNGSMFDRGIRVWQWRDNHFVDLVDEIRMGGPSQWHFDVSDLDGKPILQTSEYVNGVGGPITTTYTWNGNVFEPISLTYTN